MRRYERRRDGIAVGAAEGAWMCDAHTRRRATPGTQHAASRAVQPTAMHAAKCMHPLHQCARACGNLNAISPHSAPPSGALTQRGSGRSTTSLTRTPSYSITAAPAQPTPSAENCRQAGGWAGGRHGCGVTRAAQQGEVPAPASTQAQHVACMRARQSHTMAQKPTTAHTHIHQVQAPRILCRMRASPAARLSAGWG